MLVFDIETTGLGPACAQITLVCTEDFHTGERKAYEFARVKAQTPNTAQRATAVTRLMEDLVAALDAAPSLCAFNGVRFDLPFIIHHGKVPEQKAKQWMNKTSDLLEVSRQVYRSTFKADILAKANGISGKIASGLDAIEWARTHQFDKLLEYCVDDVRILCDVYRKRWIQHPVLKVPWDLARCAPAGLYEEHAARTVEAAQAASGSGDGTAAAGPENAAVQAGAEGEPADMAVEDTGRDLGSDPQTSDTDEVASRVSDADSAASTARETPLLPSNVVQLAYRFWQATPSLHSEAYGVDLNNVIAEMIDSGRFCLSNELATSGLRRWMCNVFAANLKHAVRSGQPASTPLRMRRSTYSIDLREW